MKGSNEQYIFDFETKQTTKTDTAFTSIYEDSNIIIEFNNDNDKITVFDAITMSVLKEYTFSEDVSNTPFIEYVVSPESNLIQNEGHIFINSYTGILRISYTISEE